MSFINYINYILSCFNPDPDWNLKYFELLEKYQDLEEELNKRPSLLQFIFMLFIFFIGGFMFCFIILKGKI